MISHFLAFSLIVVLPVWDRYETGRLKTSHNPRAKIQSYQMTVAWMWIGSAIAIATLGWHATLTIRRTSNEVPWLPPGRNGFILGLAIGSALIAASIVPAIAAILSSKVREGFARQFAPLSFFLPGTAEERLWFGFVSITAGVCEEILFRGFLIRYFQDGPYHLALAFALLLSCLFFGTAHLYQGIVGVLATAALGLSYAALFLLTGSLLLPMIAHALLDLRILLLLPENTS